MKQPSLTNFELQQNQDANQISISGSEVNFHKRRVTVPVKLQKLKMCLHTGPGNSYSAVKLKQDAG